MQIVIYGKIVHLIRKVPLTVYLLMDSISRMPGILRKNLGSPTGRSQQDTLLFQLVKCFYQRTNQGSFSRSRISFQKKQSLYFSTKKEVC